MREECYKIIMGDMLIGITPAHAGRIETITITTSRMWDHPRACGKNIIMDFAKRLKEGSPPRMREESPSTQ